MALQRIVLWSALSAAVFLAFLGNAKIVTSHEQRLARTAANMARSGWPWAAEKMTVPLVGVENHAASSQPARAHDFETLTVNPWIIPVFEGEIRLQKPPLPYWYTAVMFRLFGEGDGVARTIPAAMGTISCWLMYVLARRTSGRRVAWIAVAVWISSHFIVSEYRKAMVDPCLACLSLAAIVAWVEASAKDGRRLVPLWFFYVLLAAGALAKGPLVFLHVGVAAAAYAWCYRRWPRVPWWGHVAGAALLLAIALPWPVYVASHVPHALEVWRFESVGEFADNQRNARPVWFYLPQLFLITVPWTAFAIASVVTFARRPRWRGRRMLPMVWIVALLLVFSASHMKKNAYLLPIMPAFVLLIAGEVNRLLAFARLRKRGDQWWTTGHAIAGVGFAIFTTVASALAKIPVPATVAVAIFTIGVSLVPLKFSLRRRASYRWLIAQAVGFAVIIAAFNDFPQAWRQNAKAMNRGAAIDP